jgi:hypothetical protein
MPNVGIVAHGDDLFKRLVESGLAQELEEMAKDLRDGLWGLDDLVEVTVEEKGKKLKVSVITPNHYEHGPIDTDMYPYAIDRRTYELLVQTSNGWQRTGYIVRFVLRR